MIVHMWHMHHCGICITMACNLQGMLAYTDGPGGSHAAAEKTVVVKNACLHNCCFIRL